MQSVAFFIWLLSLGMMFLSFSHDVACINTAFFLMGELYYNVEILCLLVILYIFSGERSIQISFQTYIFFLTVRVLYVF